MDKKNIKLHCDHTFPILILLFGCIAIFPIIISKYSISLLGIIWETCCGLIIFTGVWRFEHFEISGDTLTKVNLGGLYRKDLNMCHITRYTKKVIDMNHFRNPFNIIKLFSKEEKYFKFRTIKLQATDNLIMIINERNMHSEDFKKLYHIIKTYQKRQVNSKSLIVSRN
jgi:hypothetical protein